MVVEGLLRDKKHQITHFVLGCYSRWSEDEIDDDSEDHEAMVTKKLKTSSLPNVLHSQSQTTWCVRPRPLKGSIVM